MFKKTRNKLVPQIINNDYNNYSRIQNDVVHTVSEVADTFLKNKYEVTTLMFFNWLTTLFTKLLLKHIWFTTTSRPMCTGFQLVSQKNGSSEEKCWGNVVWRYVILRLSKDIIRLEATASERCCNILFQTPIISPRI